MSTSYRPYEPEQLMRAGVAVLRREAAGEQVWNKARLGDSFEHALKSSR
jgi:hypothetical protein